MTDINIGGDNISKENGVANVYLNGLQNLHSLIVGPNSCKNVFLFQLGRLTGWMLTIDLVMLTTFSVGEAAFCRCRSVRFISRTLYSYLLLLL